MYFDPQGHDEFIFKFSSAPNLFPFCYFLVLETLAKGRLVDPATDSKYLMFEAPPAMPPVEPLWSALDCVLFAFSWNLNHPLALMALSEI